MNKFVGREEESKTLENAYKSDSFEFFVLYGRRRIGKTELLKRFSAGKNAIFFTATQDTPSMLLRDLSRSVTGTDSEFSSFSSLLEYIATISKERRTLLIIDEFPYLAHADNSILSQLQRFIDHEAKETKLFLILSGSSLSFMEDNVLGEESPLFGRRTGQIKLLPLSPKESASLLPPSWNLKDISSAYIITNGIPLYLDYFSKYDTLKDALSSLFFSRNGLLSNEAQMLLMMETRKYSTYNGILRVIAEGNNEVGKIADKTGLDKATVSFAIKKLERDMDILEPYSPLLARSKPKYRIKDSFFSFFYRFISSNISRIELGDGERLLERTLIELPAFIGKEIEKTIRNHILINYPVFIERIGFYQGYAKETNSNEEIDIVALLENGKVLCGEIKWRGEATGYKEYETLVKRSAMIPSKKGYEYIIVSREGFSKELFDIDNLTLIDGHDIFF